MHCLELFIKTSLLLMFVLVLILFLIAIFCSLLLIILYSSFDSPIDNNSPVDSSIFTQEENEKFISEFMYKFLTN